MASFAVGAPTNGLQVGQSPPQGAGVGMAGTFVKQFLRRGRAMSGALAVNLVEFAQSRLPIVRTSRSSG